MELELRDRESGERNELTVVEMERPVSLAAATA